MLRNVEEEEKMQKIKRLSKLGNRKLVTEMMYMQQHQREEARRKMASTGGILQFVGILKTEQ